MTESQIQEVKQGTWAKFLYNTRKPFGEIKSKQYQVIRQFSHNCKNLEHTLQYHALKTGALSWEIVDESNI